MARWRLMTGHYLNILQDGQPIEWEYKETDRTTGRQGRKVFHVPALLDPNIPTDHNYPGEIIVCDHESKAFPRDIVFFGEPTPDMEPLDEEAEAISANLAPKWAHPIESLSSTVEPNYDELTRAMMDAFARQTSQPVSTKNADPDRLAALEALVQDLQAQLATQSPTSPLAKERRV